MASASKFIFAVRPPAALSMPGFGVDISNSSVKCIELGGTPFARNLKTHVEMAIDSGVIVDGDIEPPDKLVDVLRTIRLKYGVKNVHASLPEKKAFIYQTLVPTGRAPQDAIAFDLEAHVPLPPEEIAYDFDFVREEKEGRIYTVTAFARRVTEAYERAVIRAGMLLKSLEVESQSLARAVVSTANRTRTMLIVEVGKRTTRICITDRGTVSYTATAELGGDMLTDALVRHFSISSDEAETIKNEQGFLVGSSNTEVVEAMANVVSVMKDEIASHLSYWNSPTIDDLPRLPIDGIIISGGNANMAGFAPYLERVLKVPVTVANVWTNAFDLDTYIPDVPRRESLEYGTAVGLALKGSDSSLW